MIIPTERHNLSAAIKSVRRHCPRGCGEDFPNGRVESPNAGDEVPNGGEESPNERGEVPNALGKSPNEGREVPNAREESPNGGGAVPNARVQNPNGSGEVPNAPAENPNVGDKNPRREERVLTGQQRLLMRRADIAACGLGLRQRRRAVGSASADVLAIAENTVR